MTLSGGWTASPERNMTLDGLMSRPYLERPRDVDEPPSEKAASSIDVQRYAADQISASIAERFTG